MNKQSECCTDVECKCSCRNNYFDGKRLTTDSFRVEQRYLLERRWLLNRSVLGWGVVYGFAVSGTSGRLTIGPGLALDECGRELLQCGEQQVAVKDILVVDDQGARSDLDKAIFTWSNSSGTPPEKVCWLLSAHYAEQSSGPVMVSDGCGCDHEEWERTCETVRYSLRPIDCADCCKANECKLHCDCATGPCCGDDVAGAAHTPKRGGCRCLCDYLTRREPGPDCCPLTEEIDEPCGHVRVDPKHGVPLACVHLVGDSAKGWTLTGEIDPCGPRQLVKGNDLLFDLIQGCDLTRILHYGWEEWHRGSVDFDAFSKAFDAPTKFWVEFSRPVRTESLRPDCFAMTAMSEERRSGWWQVFRAPIVDVEPDQSANQKGDPADCVRRATIVFADRWLKDEVTGATNLFFGSPTYIEIEVRGDFIVDCNGRTVDANAAGLTKVPPGNGTPGDTFLSTFTVAPAKGAQS